MRRRAARALLALISSAAVAAPAAGAAAAGVAQADAVAARPATGIVPPRNPPSNIVAVPRLVGAACTSRTTGATTTYHCDNPCANAKDVLAGKPPALDTSASCTAAAVAAIDRARRSEHVAALVLPRDWAALSVPEQLFVIADLERVARGVPPLTGLVPALDAAATAGARADADPLYPLSAAQPGPEASNWAGGQYSALIADYAWMYQDGWGPGNGNGDCSGPGARGCWGHRDDILGAATGTSCGDCLMGAGFVARTGSLGTSYAEIFLRPAPHSDLKPTFTWSHDVLPELPRG